MMIRIGDRCDRLVRTLARGWGYKIYKREDAARKAGAKRCGGEVKMDWDIEHVSGVSEHGHYRAHSEFRGWEVRCSKCKHVYAVYSVYDDEVEEAIRCLHNGEDIGGGRAG